MVIPEIKSTSLLLICITWIINAYAVVISIKIIDNSS
jgi:hypothetical protein